MYTKILIATDGSDLAGKAVDHGLQLAKSVGAEVVFVTVTELWTPSEMAGEFEKGELAAVQAYEESAKRSAEARLRDASALAQSLGVVSQTHHVKDSGPAKGIMDTADHENCDLIVMASHGRRGLRKMLLGSQTSEVLTLSKRPVLVLR